LLFFEIFPLTDTYHTEGALSTPARTKPA